MVAHRGDEGRVIGRYFSFIASVLKLVYHLFWLDSDRIKFFRSIAMFEIGKTSAESLALHHPDSVDISAIYRGRLISF